MVDVAPYANDAVTISLIGGSAKTAMPPELDAAIVQLTEEPYYRMMYIIVQSPLALNDENKYEIQITNSNTYQRLRATHLTQVFEIQFLNTAGGIPPATALPSSLTPINGLSTTMWDQVSISFGGNSTQTNTPTNDFAKEELIRCRGWQTKNKLAASVWDTMAGWCYPKTYDTNSGQENLADIDLAANNIAFPLDYNFNNNGNVLDYGPNFTNATPNANWNPTVDGTAADRQHLTPTFFPPSRNTVYDAQETYRPYNEQFTVISGNLLANQPLNTDPSVPKINRLDLMRGHSKDAEMQKLKKYFLPDLYVDPTLTNRVKTEYLTHLGLMHEAYALPIMIPQLRQSYMFELRKKRNKLIYTPTIRYALNTTNVFMSITDTAADIDNYTVLNNSTLMKMHWKGMEVRPDVAFMYNNAYTGNPAGGFSLPYRIPQLRQIAQVAGDTVPKMQLVVNNGNIPEIVITGTRLPPMTQAQIDAQNRVPPTRSLFPDAYGYNNISLVDYNVSAPLNRSLRFRIPEVMLPTIPGVQNRTRTYGVRNSDFMNYTHGNYNADILSPNFDDINDRHQLNMYEYQQSLPINYATNSNASAVTQYGSHSIYYLNQTLWNVGNHDQFMVFITNAYGFYDQMLDPGIPKGQLDIQYQFSIPPPFGLEHDYVEIYPFSVSCSGANFQASTSIQLASI